jgi:hypothetical protein
MNESSIKVYQFVSGSVSVPLQNHVGDVDHFTFAVIVQVRANFLANCLVYLGEILGLRGLFHQFD